jgi:hypothetical protein
MKEAAFNEFLKEENKPNITDRSVIVLRIKEDGNINYTWSGNLFDMAVLEKHLSAGITKGFQLEQNKAPSEQDK